MTVTTINPKANNHMKLIGLVFAALILQVFTVDLVLAEEFSGAGGFGIKRLVEPQYPDLKLAPEEPPPVQRVLPPAPLAPEQATIASLQRIFVRSIVVEGNTLLPEQEIRGLVSPYENREVTVAELHELRHQLSLAYFDLGFVNSGAVIPDQKVVDGTVILQVIEGVLTEIDLSGNTRLRDDYIRKRISPGVEEILNANRLQDSLRLLQQNPLIQKVNARLLPGDAPGEAILDMKVKESKPYTVGVGFDNYRSPSIGSEHGYLFGTHRNLTGRGDLLNAEIGLTEGLNEYVLGYQIPVSARGTLLGISYELNEATVIEEPFDEIDIESETDRIGIYLSHPFKRGINTQLTGLVGFDARHSESELLGEPFSFSPGVQDGESDVSALWTGLEWTQRGPMHALALRGTYRQGVDVLDATINDHDPDGTFQLFLFQFQYLQRLNYYGMHVLARSTIQRSLDPLLPIEKMGVGGRYSVRGYRENQYVRDNGVAATLEARIPLFQDQHNQSRYNLTLAGFFDYGRSWDEDDDLPTSDPANISSIGLGLLWTPVKQVSAELYWGYALDDVNTPDNNLQDDGISFSVVYRFL